MTYFSKLTAVLAFMTLAVSASAQAPAVLERSEATKVTVRPVGMRHVGARVTRAPAKDRVRASEASMKRAQLRKRLDRLRKVHIRR